MTPTDADKLLRDKIAKAFLPADLCSTDPAAIEALLDGTNASAFSEDKVQRMMKKLNGELPLGAHALEEPDEPEWNDCALNEEEEALVAMHKNATGNMTPDIQEKLRKLREQARIEPPKEDGQ